MTYILSGWEKSAIKGKKLTFYGIKEYLAIPYIIGYVIKKVRGIDLVGEGDIDPSPLRKW